MTICYKYRNTYNRAIFSSNSSILDTPERPKISLGQTLAITTIVAIQMVEKALGVTPRIQMSDTNCASASLMVRVIQILERHRFEPTALFINQTCIGENIANQSDDRIKYFKEFQWA